MLGVILRDATKDDSAALVSRLIQCDLTGQLYFSGFTDAANNTVNQNIPSYLPSSTICHIIGYNLSTSKYTGPRLTTYFADKQESTENNNLVHYLTERSIGVTVDRVPGTLPTLRIGDVYQVRCRLTMIGGVSLPLADNTPTYALQRTYRRQDPIHAPKLLMPGLYQPDLKLTPEQQFAKSDQNLHWLEALGDSEAQIVIRNTVNLSGYPTQAVRLIAPPSINWQLAEWLKMMDSKGQPDPAIMKNTKQNKMPVYEERTLGNLKNVLISVSGTGRFPKYVHRNSNIPYIADAMAEYFIIEPSNIFSVSKDEAIANGTTALDLSDSSMISTAILKTKKHLLDQLKTNFHNAFIGTKTSAKANFWDLPPDQRKADSLVKLWTLVVKKDNKIWVNVEPAKKQVTLYVREGDDIEFKIKCFAQTGAYLQNIFYPTAVQKDIDGYNNPIASGKNPQLKSRILSEKKFRVIHAKSKPLNPQLEDKTPGVNNQTPQLFKPSRDMRYPDRVVIERGLYFTGRTDEEVHLMAEWTDIIDDVTDPGQNHNSPVRIIHHVKKVMDYTQPAFYGKRVEGHLSFPDSHLPSPFIIEEALGNNQFARIYADIEGTRLAFHHEFGSKKFHAVRYYLAGTSRFKSYFLEKEAPEFISARTAYLPDNGKMDYPIKATQSPIAPQVAYIVPLFKTTPNPSGVEKTFTGTRIYLKRPWYSSGYYEKLAVMVDVVKPALNTNNYDILSTVGRDITSGNNGSPDPLLRFTRQNLQAGSASYLKNGVPLMMDFRWLDVCYDLDKDLWYAGPAVGDSDLCRPLFSIS